MPPSPHMPPSPYMPPSPFPPNGNFGLHQQPYGGYPMGNPYGYGSPGGPGQGQGYGGHPHSYTHPQQSQSSRGHQRSHSRPIIAGSALTLISRTLQGGSSPQKPKTDVSASS
ncbi:hypothetical protein FRC08_014553 [Ceratobasidium sp. 394]|nr:hypothetical protein FRC08_014553 [Ceratobasidium sp. 394]